MFKVGEKVKIVLNIGNESKTLQGKLLYIPQREGVDYWIIQKEFDNSEGHNIETIGIPNNHNIVMVSQIYTEEITDDIETQ